MLERTYMYSVDKQQVSIIQVGGEKAAGSVSAQIAGDQEIHNKAPSSGTVRSVSNPSGTERKEAVIAEKPDKPVKLEPVPAEKPERPPKPENLSHMSTLERRRSSNSSQNRTMSDSNTAERENSSRSETEKQVVSGKPPLPAHQSGSLVFTYPLSPSTVAALAPSPHPAASHHAGSSVASPSLLPPCSPRVVGHPHRPPRPTPPPPPVPTPTFTSSSCQTLPVKPRAASVSESTDL